VHNGVTVREITRLLRLDGRDKGGETDESDERQAGPAGRGVAGGPVREFGSKLMRVPGFDCLWWTRV
jgi:hypothetical protein